MAMINRQQKSQSLAQVHQFPMQSPILEDLQHQEPLVFTKTRRLDAVDIEQLAQEIETLRRFEYQQLLGLLEVVMVQLLLWHYQAGAQAAIHYCQRAGSILQKQARLRRHLTVHSDFESQLDSAQQLAYANARHILEQWMTLPPATFPLECPFTVEQILGE